MLGLAQFIERSNSELTRKNDLSNLRQFILFSGKKGGTEVHAEDVLAWSESLEKHELAPHTISTKLATLSALFEYFRDYGIINPNPATAKLVPRPKKPLKSPKGKALTVQEVKYLLYIINRDNPLDLRDSAIISAILRLSLRVSEICHLYFADDSLKARTSGDATLARIAELKCYLIALETLRRLDISESNLPLAIEKLIQARSNESE